MSVAIGCSTGGDGSVAGGMIAEITSPSTADAVCEPPAPGPDSVLSVIAGASIVTALKEPFTDESGWGAERNAGCSPADSQRASRSAVPISLSERPSSDAY